MHPPFYSTPPCLQPAQEDSCLCLWQVTIPTGPTSSMTIGGKARSRWKEKVNSKRKSRSVPRFLGFFRDILYPTTMEKMMRFKISPGVIPNSPGTCPGTCPGTFPELVVRNLPGTRGSEAAPAPPRNLYWQRPHS